MEGALAAEAVETEDVPEVGVLPALLRMAVADVAVGGSSGREQCASGAASTAETENSALRRLLRECYADMRVVRSMLARGGVKL